MNEIALHYKVDDILTNIIRFYGITQDPETKNYMMVLDYADNGSLRNYLDTNYNKLSWRDRVECLRFIALGLGYIHKNKLIHRDLHIGNILTRMNNVFISDMGLCKPADYITPEDTKNYGVLPYVAPEILRGQGYTQAADIYSFGIIMYEVISGLPPYYDIKHDENLAIKICQGFRPRFNIKVPFLILYLKDAWMRIKPTNSK
ncbi:Cdc15p [Rhizophagus irregularis DAOM 197198w]|uniref:Cdc15p n=1 Tax=Rhizophagus irregularis (strain DAOM 197198w) TaxID=1432141 RepID=A0A015IPP8_RHIIW|nr:Cdc15p [Rhizophagus irregularis DAOM 197198w]